MGRGVVLVKKVREGVVVVIFPRRISVIRITNLCEYSQKSSYDFENPNKLKWYYSYDSNNINSMSRFIGRIRNTANHKNCKLLIYGVRVIFAKLSGAEGPCKIWRGSPHFCKSSMEGVSGGGGNRRGRILLRLCAT